MVNNYYYSRTTGIRLNEMYNKIFSNNIISEENQSCFTEKQTHCCKKKLKDMERILGVEY